MDLASLLGLLLVTASIAYATTAGGGVAASFFDLPAAVCVVGGCTAALFLCYPLSTIAGFGSALKRAFARRPPEFAPLVAQLVSLAETARRNGLLALDSRLDEIDDPFLALGVQLAVDGTRPEVVEEILRAEMVASSARSAVQKSMFEQLGKYAPAYGMIGTLLGLVMMLGNMSDPSTIGPGMAVALLTTLYGALLANAVCLPCAEKLGFLNKQEAAAREIVLRGILAIQAGDSPRIVQQKLKMFTFAPPPREYSQAA